MALFGLPFITMQYVFVYPIAWFLRNDPLKAAEKGFKYAILPNIAAWIIPQIILGLVFLAAG